MITIYRRAMWATIIALELLLVWAIIFLIALMPSIWLGRWMVSRLSPPYYGLTACVGYAKIFVLLTATVLLFARFEFLPHVNGQRPGFTIFFSAFIFGIPVLAAFLIGLKRAKGQTLFLQQ